MADTKYLAIAATRKDEIGGLLELGLKNAALSVRRMDTYRLELSRSNRLVCEATECDAKECGQSPLARAPDILLAPTPQLPGDYYESTVRKEEPYEWTLDAHVDLSPTLEPRRIGS